MVSKLMINWKFSFTGLMVWQSAMARGGDHCPFAILSYSLGGIMGLDSLRSVCSLRTPVSAYSRRPF